MVTRKKKASKFLELMDAASAYITEEKPKSESPEDIARVMRPLTQDLTQESFFIVLLNTKNRILSIEAVTTGLVDRAPIHAREAFRMAIVQNASRIVLVHNHPSGDPTPSTQDIACTRQLVEAGKIIGIEVIDHVVLGEKTESRYKDYISFREEGLI